MSKKRAEETEQESQVTQEIQDETPDYQAMYQRALADAENARKRFADERAVISKFAIGDLVLELLPVLDNFTRATEHVPDEQKESPWTAGILYIRKQLMDVLAERGVSEIIPAAGSTFDPEVQEAVETVVDEAQPVNTVLATLTPGYRLHERVIRPARVRVTITNETK